MHFNLLFANTTLFLFGVGILGLLVGSFLNVVIYRLPLMVLNRPISMELIDPPTSKTNINLLQPRSFCPYCREHIPLWLNIPIISYLLLRGRTGCCQEKFLCVIPL